MFNVLSGFSNPHNCSGLSTILRWSNTSNKLLQLATQHCCIASWKALLAVLPPTSNIVTQQYFVVASWSSMLTTTTATVLKRRCKGGWLTTVFDTSSLFYDFNTAETILVSVLKWILKIDFISSRVHVVLRTWKCLRWRCLQNEVVVKLNPLVHFVLRSLCFAFTLFCVIFIIELIH